jgi:hypothetical protein
MKIIRNIAALITGLAIAGIGISAIIIINKLIFATAAPAFVIYICVLVNSTIAYKVFNIVYKSIDAELTQTPE